MKNKRYPSVGGLMVLKSEAGYYIGRLYYYAEDDAQPYSRESTYMPDEATAIKALAENDYVQVFNDY